MKIFKVTFTDNEGREWDSRNVIAKNAHHAILRAIIVRRKEGDRYHNRPQDVHSVEFVTYASK